MFKRLCQLIALAILGALLVFAPEILTAVSAPYRVKTQERVLLRVALCTQDQQAAASFYKALETFRAQHGGVHLRVTRVDEAQLAALPEPPPDVYVYSPQIELPMERLFLPLEVLSGDEAPADDPGIISQVRYAFVFEGDEGEALLCAVGAGTSSAPTARALADCLRGDTP